MSTIIGDGEPYEPEQPTQKLDLNLALSTTPLEDLITLNLSSQNSQIPPKLTQTSETNLKLFSNTQIRSTEHKLNFIQLLLTLLPSLSDHSLQTWVFPIFINYSKDDYFSIRKLCALHIGKYLNSVPSNLHRSLLEAFSRFMVDKNVLVVQAAFSSLGLMMYFLSELDDRVLHWAQMLSCSDLSQAGELAYYLPAVYRKFPLYRESLLGIWRSLLKNPQSQVRSKAASTLGFFIRNTGVETCLAICSTYQNLLKDTDIVKVEAISHLGSFLEKIPESTQSQFLGIYRRIQTYNLNWRVNLKIAKSLVKIAKNLRIEYWVQELWQVSLALVQDNSEVVRMKSAKALGTILKDLWGISQQWDALMSQDLGKLLNGSYKKRQVLAYVCGVCWEIEWFDRALGVLVADSVIDVRLAVATMACQYNIPALLEKLRTDESPSVRSLLAKKQISWPKAKKSFGICKEFKIALNEFDEVFKGDE